MTVTGILSKQKFLLILLVGVIARLILMPITAHPFDVAIWYNISTEIVDNGPFTLIGYPPVWYHYFMVPVAYAYSWLSGIFSPGTIPMSSLPSSLNFYPSLNVDVVPGMLFNTVVKTPFFLSDVLVTFLLYKIVKEYTGNKGYAEKAAVLWFLNPLVIWISAGWGMWDSLPVLFSLLALLFLVKGRFGFSAVCLSVAVGLKLYPALFLVPMIYYICKKSPTDKKRRCGWFFLVFSVTTLLWSLPYLSVAPSLLSNFFVVNAGSVSDQINNPVGYGLTYWSLSGLTRFVNVSITSGIAFALAIISIVSVAVFAFWVYWRVRKVETQKSLYTLAFVLLLPLLAVFLTYRVIQEQWFLWLTPFLIILCVSGKVKRAYYWGLSILALLYALLNCPLPFFFLPLAPWGTGTLVSLANFFLSCEPLRNSVLAAIGCLFSILVVLLVLKFRPLLCSQRQNSDSP